MSNSDQAVFTVNPVNDPPSFTKGTDQTVAEDAGPQTVSNWATAISDGDPEATQVLTFSVSNNNNTLFSSQPAVSPDGTLTYTPAPNANGNATVTVILYDDGVTNNQSPPQTFTITVTAVNDPPTFTKGADQNINEDSGPQNIGSWAANISDGDPELTQLLTFNVTNNNNPLFLVQPAISSSGTLTYTPAINAYGAATVTVILVDNGTGTNQSAPQTFSISIAAVNDAPVVDDIPGQSVNEGTSFSQINLNNYVLDVDNADNEINWSFSGNNNLSVSITLGIATITPLSSEWNGSETITFRATDPGTLYDTDDATFTVLPVNDPPVVTDILDQTISEGAAFAQINLDDYVSDADNPDAQIIWTYTGNSELEVVINNRIATITTPDPDWFGAETITFRATDPGGLFDTDPVTFTVTGINDAPVVSEIPGQTINEGSVFATITLDNYVSDVDNTDAQMVWTYSGNTQLAVSIVNRVATINVPNADWFGSETITFTATDPGPLSDSYPVTFTVTAVNDAPVVSGIPDQTIAEGGTFATITLDNYVSDVDNTDAQMTWTWSGNSSLSVSITNRIATITAPNSNWNGSETITFRATDSGSLFDEDAAVFTVTAVNDPPVVSDIPNQTIAEGATFTTISLDNYVDDPDNTDSEMIWTWSGNGELQVSVSPARIATITTPDPDWNGSRTIIFRATDPGGLYDEDGASFTVSADNDPPVVANIPDQIIAEGGTFATIALDNYVADPDNPDSEISWTFTGNSSLTVSIINNVATITIPNINWNGSETITFRATDPLGLSNSDAATFTVTPVNDPPVITDIPDQSIPEGSAFTPINLDDYVSDVDDSDNQITWSYSGNSSLSVNISDRIATITVPNADWNGSETITFTASDDDGASVSDQASFTVTAVNDPPVVTDIPNQTIAEGSAFVTIPLSTYVSDVDNTDEQMTWTYSGDRKSVV